MIHNTNVILMCESRLILTGRVEVNRTRPQDLITAERQARYQCGSLD